MSREVSNNEARDAIMQSIRAHLAASPRLKSASVSLIPHDDPGANYQPATGASDLKMFCERLESVGGHCVIVRDEDEAARALTRIVSELQASDGARRIALSDAALVSRLTRDVVAEQLEVCPQVSDLFSYDAGVTTAQAGIAETGTLILEAEKERHRLVSLLPPVHIAVVRAQDICSTIGDALKRLRGNGESGMSRAITFITGPSRTADIELTLTIGVHGPKELHVIVIDGEPEAKNGS